MGFSSPSVELPVTIANGGHRSEAALHRVHPCHRQRGDVLGAVDGYGGGNKVSRDGYRSLGGGGTTMGNENAGRAKE